MAVDWSSLPPDLVRRIGDHHLAASDIDYYMDMRSVCHSWRSAMPKPRPLGVGADYRFRPRQWVMVDESESKVDADDRRLFVNVSTGRFLYRRVPMLRDHDLLAASAGLLVLREKISPHTTCVLDPFTGTVLPTPDNYEDEDMITVYSVADPASELGVVQFPLKSDDCPWFDVRSIVTHAGHVYVLDSVGHVYVFRIIDAEERLSYGYGELIARMDFGLDGSMLYLVECAGELLVVRLQQICSAAEVYRVDVERKVLERLHGIGRRALFLGLTRCLWVDADKFPSIDPNCLYREQTHYSEEEMRGWRETYRYDLSNGGRRDDVIDDLNMNTDGPIGPISSAKVLHDYCISDLPPFLHFSSP